MELTADELKRPVAATRDDEMPADHPRVVELRAKGHTGPMYEVGASVPRSRRGGVRTKGTPFSRVKLVEVILGKKGVPAQFHYRHLTRGTERTVTATPETIGHFMGGNLPFHMVSELLGGL